MAERTRGVTKHLLIGGSGAYALPDHTFGKLMEKGSVRTPFGESGVFSLFEHEGFRFHFLSRHGEGGYDVSAPFVNYRANIFGARMLGVERIIAWSGPGIINEDLVPATFLVPTDIIDFTKSRKSTFFDHSGLGFIRQNPVFCEPMGEILSDTARGSKRGVVKGGTYVCTEGPRLETPAEIKMFRMWGADVVGMTIVPEAFLARELEMCYQPICYLTNYAEGVRDMPYRDGVLFEGMLPDELGEDVDRAKEELPRICIAALRELDNLERNCPCSVSMKRYREKGLIGEDFRAWVKGESVAAE